MSALTRLIAAIQSRSVRQDDGASLVEYALLVALIAIVAVVAITAFGGALSDEFDSIATELP
jgi:pilus assembly protein Flp/PilA